MARSARDERRRTAAADEVCEFDERWPAAAAHEHVDCQHPVEQLGPATQPLERRRVHGEVLTQSDIGRVDADRREVEVRVRHADEVSGSVAEDGQQTGRPGVVQACLEVFAQQRNESHRAQALANVREVVQLERPVGAAAPLGFLEPAAFAHAREDGLRVDLLLGAGRGVGRERGEQRDRGRRLHGRLLHGHSIVCPGGRTRPRHR